MLWLVVTYTTVVSERRQGVGHGNCPAPTQARC